MSRGDGTFYRQIATTYASCRPSYPDELFEYLAALAPARTAAWDCGTGNGQAARSLGAHFTRVVATDRAPEQLALAEPDGNVEYQTAEAEQSGLPDGSVDLVTAAQAIHWFDLNRFYPEVRRVLRPSGVLAVWCYRLPQVGAHIDELICSLYDSKRLTSLWPPERKMVDAGYATLPFPFAEQVCPAFEMIEQWAFPRFAAYLRTWQAVADAGRDSEAAREVDCLLQQLAAAWGEGVREVRWRLSLRVGRYVKTTS